MSFTLVIKSFEDKTYRHEVAKRPTKEALYRIEDGANINLNHAEYYTGIEEDEDA